MRSKPENALAQVVARWFRNSDWDVYEEVGPENGEGATCDLVAVESGTGSVRMIEAKMKLPGPVVAQAVGWLNHAHGCYVAIPWVKRASRACKTWAAAHELLQVKGIGLIMVHTDGTILIDERPRLNAAPAHLQSTIACFSSALMDTGQAGTAGGKVSASKARKWIPLIDAVQADPGITLKELFEDLYDDTQAYAGETPQKWRNRLLKAVESGRIPQVRIKTVVGISTFYPVESGT